ncbi:NUDIX domain-containing protein [Dyadobacter sandarakinus]|uniref:NUDIX domain-containing protein n=1 Tax=Dyadobacter sandarakinus TaxID=2747268 RepID=A0ABX7I628_9BACT|nr:NUDIX domain-containing protein [Dyadobacter sandarakinus]QRR00997.1 NUDIX domain-containing protein [Dyadobacter sandarakinus]
MPRQSAGILLYRKTNNELEVLLVHPGGPFFVKKDLGSWTIPKGEYDDSEEALAAAQREFEEEIGSPVTGTFLPLGTIRQKGGKVIQAWAVEGDLDADAIVSNTFELAWPPKSGKVETYPEVDKAVWFSVAEAKTRINEKQAELIDRLVALVV